MKRFMTILVSLGVAVFLTATPLSAKSTDNSASFADPVGDVPADFPDITSVEVSSDNRGWITFVVRVPNRPVLPPDTRLSIFFDADDLDSGGYWADHAIAVSHWAATQNEGVPLFGTLYDKGRVQAFGFPRDWGKFSWEKGVATISVDGRLLAVTSPEDFRGYPSAYSARHFWPPKSFTFKVYAFAYGKELSSDSYIGYDEAPSATRETWSYDVKLLRELIVKSFIASKTVKAGNILTAKMTAVRDDNSQVATGKPICRAKIGKTLLRLLNPPLLVAAAARPSAICSWLVPKAAKSKAVIKGVIGVSAEGPYDDISAVKTFSVKVK